MEQFKDVIRHNIANSTISEEKLYWESLGSIASAIDIETAFLKYRSDCNNIFNKPNFSWATTDINKYYKSRLYEEDDDNSEELWNRR